MSNGVTTGGEVLRSGTAAALFALLCAVWVAILEKRKDWARGRLARVWNWGLCAVVGIGGVIAMIVGLVMLATDTTFGS